MDLLTSISKENQWEITIELSDRLHSKHTHLQIQELICSLRLPHQSVATQPKCDQEFYISFGLVEP